MDFLRSTEVHQRPDATTRYEYGANPEENQEDLPYHLERRPEIGRTAEDSAKLRLEMMQDIIVAALNKLGNEDPSPYVVNELNKSYKHLREAYLRIMDA